MENQDKDGKEFIVATWAYQQLLGKTIMKIVLDPITDTYDIYVNRYGLNLCQPILKVFIHRDRDFLHFPTIQISKYILLR